MCQLRSKLLAHTVYTFPYIVGQSATEEEMRGCPPLVFAVVIWYSPPFSPFANLAHIYTQGRREDQRRRRKGATRANSQKKYVREQEGGRNPPPKVRFYEGARRTGKAGFPPYHPGEISEAAKTFFGHQRGKKNPERKRKRRRGKVYAGLGWRGAYKRSPAALEEVHKHLEQDFFCLKNKRSK